MKRLTCIWMRQQPGPAREPGFPGSTARTPGRFTRAVRPVLSILGAAALALPVQAGPTVAIKPAIITLNADLVPAGAAAIALTPSEAMWQIQAGGRSDWYQDVNSTLSSPLTGCSTVYAGSYGLFPTIPLVGTAKPVPVVTPGLNATVTVPASYYNAVFATSADYCNYWSCPAPLQNEFKADYTVDASALLAGGRKSYVFAQVPIHSGSPIWAAQWPLPNNRSVTENPGVMQVRLFCPEAPGTSLAPVTAARVSALINPGGTTPQAEILSLASGAGVLDDKLFVRGNLTYDVNILYTVNLDEFLNRYTWGCTVPSVYVPANTAAPVPVDCFSRPCNALPPCPNGGTNSFFSGIFGTVNLPPNNNPSLGTTWMAAVGGPYGNYRYGHLDTPTAVSGPYTLPNVVALNASGASGVDYTVYANMTFPLSGQTEHFTSPCITAHVETCAPQTDLLDIFDMHEGYVEGNILLKGLIDVANCPCISTLVLPDSYVAAKGPCTGAATVGFGGAAFGPGSFNGTYKLALAGLKPASGSPDQSTWDPNIFGLRFYDSGSGVESHVKITDLNFASQNIVAGATLTHDLKYCFGYVEVRFVNNELSRPFSSPTLRGGGSFGVIAPAVDDWGNVAKYTVEASASGVMLPNTWVNEGVVRLCLPVGTYTFTPSVSYLEGTATVPDITLTVGCMEKIITNVFGGPAIFATNASCVKTEQYLLTGQVTNDVNIQEIFYVRNGIKTVVGTSYAATSVPLSIPLTLTPCANDLTIYAVDINGAVTSQSVHIVFDNVPPVITDCTNIVASLPSGQTTVFVNYAVTATDACSPPVTLTCTPPPGLFAAGVHPVHCVAVDACGNTNWCDFTITVRGISSGTNCCDDCFPPYTASYSVVVQPGFNFIANVLCRSNMTLNGLLPIVPDDSMALRWDAAAQDFDPNVATYLGGWMDNWTFALGEGFALYNPGNAYTNLFYGCEPTCPLPCRPTNNACQLVSGHGLGTNTWSNLYSCPPECGTVLSVWNTTTQDWDPYTYLDGSGWSPSTPHWAPGLSVMVCVKANTNCCTNNLVLNGSFELTSPVVAAGTSDNTLDPTTGVPGWTTTLGNYLEVWANTHAGIPASRGVNHLEINAQSVFQSVAQVITNANTNCMAKFCFDYTGLGGLVGNTPNNDFTVMLSGGHSLSVTLDPAAYGVGGWQRYCVEFQPTASTITIQFLGHPHDTLAEGGAHIDNVSLTQCCSTNPRTAPLFIHCATNKTVECGSAWTFNVPTATNDCCGTNITFAIASTVTNGTFCSNVITRVWRITDCKGNSGTCTQAVTVVDTTPPILICANNKTAFSSEAWSFDPPSASDTCSGASVTIAVLRTVAVSDGPCVRLVTRTWVATDACGKTNTCHQTVTVFDTTPPALLQCPTNIIACLGTNGCGVMPDATGQVLASDPSGTVIITQSIPAGQWVCTNTVVVFTITDLCGNATNCAALVELQPCCVKPPKGMKLWLTFDESVGVTCLNSMGGNNGVRYDGTVTASSTTGPTRQAGQYVNRSLCFDGVNDSVIVKSYAGINPRTNDFSIDLWVKWDGTLGTLCLLDKRTANAAHTVVVGYALFLQGGAPRLFLGDGSPGPGAAWTAPTTVPVNQWAHLAVTVDRDSPTGIQFYVNGLPVIPTFNPLSHQGSLSTTAPLWIGDSTVSTTALPFRGCLDEIEIFNRVLTTNEVWGLYLAGTSGKCRPFCTVPSVVNICRGSVTISATICNPGAIGQWFGVSFTGLTAAQTGLPNAINWPASPNPFTPPATSVYVGPNSCVTIPVTITEPPGLSSGWSSTQKKAVYQMIISSGGQKFTCLGTVVDQWWNCPVSPGNATNATRATNVVLQATNVTRVPVVFHNATNVPLSLNLIASVLDDAMMLDTNTVSLNGLPPGTPVTDQIILPPGSSGTVMVDVSFTDPQPGTPFYLVLQADVGESGAFEPVASVTLLNVIPATVGPVLNLGLSSGQPVVSWDVVNSPFVLESSPSLGGTNWVPVLDPVVPLPDGSQGVILPPSAGSRFFRGSQ